MRRSFVVLVCLCCMFGICKLCQCQVSHLARHVTRLASTLPPPPPTLYCPLSHYSQLLLLSSLCFAHQHCRSACSVCSSLWLQKSTLGSFRSLPISCSPCLVLPASSCIYPARINTLLKMAYIKLSLRQTWGTFWLGNFTRWLRRIFWKCYAYCADLSSLLYLFYMQLKL